MFISLKIKKFPACVRGSIMLVTQFYLDTKSRDRIVSAFLSILITRLLVSGCKSVCYHSYELIY